MNEMRFERSSPLACLELEHIEIDFGFAQLAVVLRNGNFRRQMHDSIIVANDHEYAIFYTCTFGYCVSVR